MQEPPQHVYNFFWHVSQFLPAWPYNWAPLCYFVLGRTGLHVRPFGDWITLVTRLECWCVVNVKPKVNLLTEARGRCNSLIMKSQLRLYSKQRTVSQQNIMYMVKKRILCLWHHRVSCECISIALQWQHGCSCRIQARCSQCRIATTSFHWVGPHSLLKAQLASRWAVNGWNPKVSVLTIYYTHTKPNSETSFNCRK